MKSFRLFHALFGALVLAAYLTGEETGVAHAWIGYAVASLILLRLSLGLMHQSGFAFHRLLPRLGAGHGANRGLRHPAIAQVLTLSLALAVSGTAVTGVAMDRGGTFAGKSVRLDDARDEGRGDGHGGASEESEGDDLSAYVLGLVPPARADDGENESDGDEGPLAEVHEGLGSIILPLAFLHVVYTLIFRLDFARFMLFLPRRGRA